MIDRARLFPRLLWVVLLLGCADGVAIAAAPQQFACGHTLSLDAPTGWLLAADPNNIGKAENWFAAPYPNAKPTPVPWVIQDVLDGYHGVAWYWREFDCPPNPDPQGRFLLRFEHVDYLGDVWVNGKYLGGHEGADGGFTLDATDAVKPGGKNLLAVRVLNPTDAPIDGFLLAETPHRNKTSQFTFGCDYNHGGIEGSVDLVVAPAVRIADLYVRPNPETGVLAIEATVENSLPAPAQADLAFTVAPAREGATIDVVAVARQLAPGRSVVTAELKVPNPRRWELDDPYLYRVTAHVQRQDAAVADEQSVRTGFRDFRIDDAGWFTLNGRRIFLRCSHTGNMAPIGMHLPYEKDWFRQDLLYTKSLGFNAIRFIAGYPTREQLDLCDELGMLAYDEAYSAWLLADSPKMPERFDRAVEQMVLRDRNRPSVVIWGLLNETLDGPIYRHAAGALSVVRKLDPDRLVLLSSGRFDLQQATTGSAANPGSNEWQPLLGGDGVAPAEKPATIYPSSKQSGDAHIYPQVPQTREAIELLRTYGQGAKPFFLSENGVASSVDLIRVARQYEQRGKASSGEAKFHLDALARFQADWDRWHMADVFGRPEEFFAQSLARMGTERLRGINALRANPLCNGYSLTGTVDQGYSGEGLTTPFRELKPGTSDVLADGLAPLRLCTFVEPPNVYRGEKVRIEVVLANEDVLAPGTYPLRVDVLDEHLHLMWTKRTGATLPAAIDGKLPPLAISIFDESPVVEWATGKYRVVATFEEDAAVAGGTAELNVTDPADMPPVAGEILLWGDDGALREWLAAHGVKATPFTDAAAQTPRVILASGRSADADKPAGFAQLLAAAERGSRIVFLTPQLLAEEGLALPCGGKIAGLWSTVYHKEEWNARSPVFAGLPAGGLMDYCLYRDLIPGVAWMRDDSAPAEVIAGAIHAAPGTGYASGLLLFADNHGAGKYYVNLFRIREVLGTDPAAERLLRNLLNAATTKVQ